MNGEARIFLLLLSISFSSMLCAETEQEFTLNGLLEGKAILVIDGKPIILANGQSKHGITLIDATLSRAIVEITGKRSTMFLDKSTNAGQMEAGQISDNLGKTHIVATSLLVQTGNLATFEVDYYYDGKAPGKYITLTAKTYFAGEPTQCSAHSYARLESGRHSVTMTVTMNDQSPKAYLSDKLKFEIHWASEKTSGVLTDYVIEFIKEWTR